MKSAKDFQIEYEQVHGREPTEEEWLDYYDSEVMKAEALKDHHDERETQP